MISSGLKSEAWHQALILFLFAVVGLLSGHFTVLLLLGLAFCLGRFFFKIHRFSRWLQETRLEEKPPRLLLDGLWSESVYNVEFLLKQHAREQQRLSAQVDRVQQMTSALSDAVILTDRRGNMTWWNSPAERLFDFRDADLGHKLTNLIRHPAFVQYFDEQVHDTPLQISYGRKSTRVEFKIHPFGDGERLVIARDFTQLFKLEQMRKDFVANVSHELRTPLTVIRGYVETLLDHPAAPQSMSNALMQMEKQCMRMTTLINDLIALSKLETDQKEIFETSVTIAPLIKHIVQDAETLSGERQHEFIVSGDPSLAILGNERELHSALSNLVINALNYSEPGDKIYIHYSKTPIDAVISVRDTGIGIDQQHLARLTERFYRVDPGRSVASGGTGLGLAIVKHVLLRHNAELTINSKVGAGSEFTCDFPLSSVDQAAMDTPD